jgi:hypothetical protein
MYTLLLLAAAVVTAFVLEFVTFVREPLRTPVFPRLDRRLAAVGGAAAFLLIGGLVTMDVLYPGWRGPSIGRNVAHPYLLLLYGPAFCLFAFLCGVKLREPVLLLCLMLPGLVVMPIVWFSSIVTSNNVIAEAIAVPFVFFLQPAVWILTIIGVGQALLLSKPGRNFTAGGLVRVSLILVAYLFGTFT